ncbi:hypothetical protein D3C71_1471120 [compost metagenome]
MASLAVPTDCHRIGSRTDRVVANRRRAGRLCVCIVLGQAGFVGARIARTTAVLNQISRITGTDRAGKVGDRRFTCGHATIENANAPLRRGYTGAQRGHVLVGLEQLRTVDCIGACGA